MEHLTKQQIVLLTLLVSFVSSIATGIVTVSLLDQSSPSVTQIINRVVERTIETVTPNETSAPATRETIVVTEDQAVVDSIAKASKSIVRIESNNQFAGLGVIVSPSGRIIARISEPILSTAVARLDGGNIVPLSVVLRDENTGIIVFQAGNGIDSNSARVFSPVSLGNSDSLKLGQSVVAASYKDTWHVSTGLISSLIRDEASEASTDKPVKRIITSVQRSDFDSQSILVNLLGEVVGLKDNTEDNAFIPSNQLKNYATP